MAVRRRATSPSSPSHRARVERSGGSPRAERSDGATESTKTAVRDIIRRYRVTFERLAR